MKFLIDRDIIDVTALDTHLLEQSEFNDRSKVYAQRLAQQWTSIPANDFKYNGECEDPEPAQMNFNLLISSGLLKDVPNPENLLTFNQSSDDIELVSELCSALLSFVLTFYSHFKIKNFVKEAAQAVNEMRVENNDELVVPFVIT